MGSNTSTPQRARTMRASESPSTNDGCAPSQPPSELTTAGVTLLVTKGLEVPTARLGTRPLAGLVTQLANEDSKQGLVDPGGMMRLSDADMVLDAGHYHGFISAACAAFANHFPLSVRPQHFWLLILQAVAKHVELDAEAVRSKWVAHEGKKELLVQRDRFVPGAANDWAGVVDGSPDSFSSQIEADVVPGVAAAISPGFSCTTELERLCEKVTVMDATKSFFSYKCRTCCGFPSVGMEGTADDWAALLAHAEALICERCEQSWGKAWLSALRPLLQRLCAEYEKGARGEAGDDAFWNSMCKRGGTGGSGSRTWFNGWVNIFFPSILDKPNPFTVPYDSSNGYVREGRDGSFAYGMVAPPDVQGPDTVDFPSGLAEAPVTWECLCQSHKLKFKAGFVGAAQDAGSGTVRPQLGWFIAHDDQVTSVMDGFPRGMRPPRRGRDQTQALLAENDQTMCVPGGRTPIVPLDYGCMGEEL